MQLTHTGSRYELLATFADTSKLAVSGFTQYEQTNLWFTSRTDLAENYVLVADDAAKAAMKRFRQRIMLSEATDADITIPVPDGKAYLAFQKAGVRYSAGQAYNLMADDMGLGKTIYAIARINYERFKRILIIPPASLTINWFKEICLWLVEQNLTIDLATSTYLPTSNIVIANYEILHKLKAQLTRRGTWDYKVCDEAHYLKNPTARRTKAVLGARFNGKQWMPPIAAECSDYMTGTPILSRPVDLWPIVERCDPDGLGSDYMEFTRRYCKAWQAPWGWDASGAANLEELRGRLRGTMMVRRMKKDVLKDLPPKRRQIVCLPVALSLKSMLQSENDFYEKNREVIEKAQKLVEFEQSKGNSITYKMAAARLKIEADVFEKMFELRALVASAKVPYIIEFLEEALPQQNNKVAVFAHHHVVIRALAQHFGNKAVTHYGESGTAEQKWAAVNRFETDPKCEVFIGAITGAVGYTIVSASYGLMAELDWSPHNITQAEDRMWRIGQLFSLLIQHLVFDGSLDALQVKTVVRKQEVIDAALN